jgi:hypothetical protein
MAMRDHTLERGLAGVGIEPEAAVADAAMPLDIGHLGHHEAGAGIGEHAKVSQVPVRSHAIVGTVLAHGRHDDAVGKCQVGEPDRREECAHVCLTIAR